MAEKPKELECSGCHKYKDIGLGEFLCSSGRATNGGKGYCNDWTTPFKSWGGATLADLKADIEKRAAKESQQNVQSTPTKPESLRRILSGWLRQKLGAQNDRRHEVKA